MLIQLISATAPSWPAVQCPIIFSKSVFCIIYFSARKFVQRQSSTSNVHKINTISSVTLSPIYSVTV